MYTYVNKYVYVTVIIKEEEIMNLRGNGGTGGGKKG